MDTTISCSSRSLKTIKLNSAEGRVVIFYSGTVGTYIHVHFSEVVGQTPLNLIYLPLQIHRVTQAFPDVKSIFRFKNACLLLIIVIPFAAAVGVLSCIFHMMYYTFFRLTRAYNLYPGPKTTIILYRPHNMHAAVRRIILLSYTVVYVHILILWYNDIRPSRTYPEPPTSHARQTAPTHTVPAVPRRHCKSILLLISILTGPHPRPPPPQPRAYTFRHIISVIF